jgi:hypothetical protein
VTTNIKSVFIKDNIKENKKVFKAN